MSRSLTTDGFVRNRLESAFLRISRVVARSRILVTNLILPERSKPESKYLAAERQVRELLRQKKRGLLNSEEYKKGVLALAVADIPGRRWITDGNGKWYFEVDGKWVLGQPPRSTRRPLNLDDNLDDDAAFIRSQVIVETLDDQLQVEIRRLKQDIQEYAHTIAKLEVRLKKEQEANKEAKKLAEASQTSLKSHEERVLALETQLQATKEAQQSLIAEKAELEVRLSDSATQLSSLLRTIQRLTSQVHEAEARIEQQTEKNALLQVKVNQFKTDLQSKEKSLEVLSDENRELKQKLIENTANVGDNANVTLDSPINEQLQNRIVELEKRLDEQVKRAEKLQLDLESLQNQNGQSIEDILNQL